MQVLMLKWRMHRDFWIQRRHGNPLFRLTLEIRRRRYRNKTWNPKYKKGMLEEKKNK